MIIDCLNNKIVSCVENIFSSSEITNNKIQIALTKKEFDGDVTLIYYPRLDWKIDWGGGTAIYNNDVTEIEKHFVNKGNRIIMFDANLPHQAQPISRLCFQLRTCIVFKTNRIT